MRKGVVPAVAIAMTVSATLSARSDDIPTLDVNPVCRGITQQGGLEAGLQQTSFQECVQSEQEVREQLKKAWSTFSAADKQHCVTLAKTGGESSYTELLTCLEMARDVRMMRSKPDKLSAAVPEGLPAPVGHRQPTRSSRSQSSLYLSTRSPSTRSSPSSPSPSSPSTAMVQPAPPTNEPSTSMVKELQQAKVDALNARTSESVAQRKLADTEADLKQAKAEAAQASNEAEQARADARAARQSTTQTERKLAESEAARMTAEDREQACQNAAKSQPGFRGWLRGLFGPSKPENP